MNSVYSSISWGFPESRRPTRPLWLGVVEAGALADLPLVDGDPTADIDLVADPDSNFLVIMKDGKIYKDTLQR